MDQQGLDGAADHHAQCQFEDADEGRRAAGPGHPGDQGEDAERGQLHDEIGDLKHHGSPAVEQSSDGPGGFPDDEDADTDQQGEEDDCQHIARRHGGDRIQRDDIHQGFAERPRRCARDDGNRAAQIDAVARLEDGADQQAQGAGDQHESEIQADGPDPDRAQSTRLGHGGHPRDNGDEHQGDHQHPDQTDEGVAQPFDLDGPLLKHQPGDHAEDQPQQDTFPQCRREPPMGCTCEQPSPWTFGRTRDGLGHSVNSGWDGQGLPERSRDAGQAGGTGRPVPPFRQKRLRRVA